MPRTPRQSARFGVTFRSMTGIVEAQQARIARPDRRILGQFDDAGMVVAEGQFGCRHQHAARGDAADRAFVQHRAGLRDAHAGRAEHALHAGPRVRRAAHDLHLTGPGIDDADAQPVGIRVRLGRDDARDDKAGQRGAAVLDALDIVAEHDEPVGDLRRRRVGVEMRLEPGQRGFHASAPRTGDGMSSGRNP